MSNNKKIPYQFFINKLESSSLDITNFERFKGHFSEMVRFEHKIDRNKNSSNDFYLTDFITTEIIYYIFEKLSYVDNIKEYIEKCVKNCSKENDELDPHDMNNISIENIERL